MPEKNQVEDAYTTEKEKETPKCVPFQTSVSFAS